MPKRSDHDPPHKPHPVAYAELARRAGRNRSQITRAAQGDLAAAKLPGGRLDAAHPSVVAWARARGIDPAALLDSGVGAARQRRESPPASATAPTDDGPADASELMNLTLRQITDRYGSAQGFIDWLEARKLIADTARTESRNERDDGRLIPRELVRTVLFGYLEQLHKRLLGEAAPTVARRVRGAGLTSEQSVALVRDTLSAELNTARRHILGGLRTIRANDNPPAVVPTPAQSADGVGERARHALEQQLRAALISEAAPTIVRLIKLGDAREESAEEAARRTANILSAHVAQAASRARNEFTAEPLEGAES